jgi:hypothetical protein
MIVLDAALFMLALAFAASLVLASWVEVAASRQPELLRLTLRAAVQGSRA